MVFRSTTFRISLLLCLLTAVFNARVYAQFFPNPSTLSTGQGTPGTNDPIWLCSPWSATIPGNPMLEVYSPTLINNNCAPGSWVDPASLPPPMNNGNWITGQESNCADNSNSGYRYFRLPLNLPPDCNGNSVTTEGNYVLNLDGYVDNSIIDVFINGIPQGISGGGFAAGSQLNIFLDGPWLVGQNYVDILVLNFPAPGTNPYGLLLVADGTSSANLDSDGDGLNDLVDLCPCDDGGTNPIGCIDPQPNTCDIEEIRAAFLAAGCIELPVCVSGCSMYFLNPASNTGSAAQAFAQSLGANLVSVQSLAENQCLYEELVRLNQNTGVIWIGLSDEQTEGNFLWYDQSPVTFTNWAPGEPNQSGDEDCVQIYYNGANPGTWNDLSCSSASSKSIIEINLCPVLNNPGPDVQTCLNDNSIITAGTPILGSSPYDYIWTNGPTTQSQTVFTTVDSTFIANIFDRYNCSTADTVSVIIKPLPIALPNPYESSICSGTSTSISLTSSPAGGSFTWSQTATNVSGASNASGNVISQVLTATTGSPGEVTYTITPLLNGCLGSDTTAIVEVISFPTIFADTSLCADTYQINANDITSTGSGTWSELNGNGTFTPSNSTMAAVLNPVPGVTNYTLIFTDAICGTDTANVLLAPLPEVTAPLVSCDMTEANIVSTSYQGGSWSATNPSVTFNGGQVIGTSNGTTSISVPAAGSYTLTFTTNDFCNLTETITLNFAPYLYTQINDTVLCFGEQFQLQAVVPPTPAQFIWNNGSTETSLPVNDSGLYFVEVYNECPSHTYADSAFIQFIVCEMTVPNIISLSSTAGNDKWFPTANGVSEYHCTIFNRWGNVVYEYSDISGSWDGKDQSGKVVAEGVYFYSINVQFTHSSEEVNKQGLIHVVH
ncbi:MAG: lectin-like protein [Bacteroidota bacterium]